MVLRKLYIYIYYTIFWIELSFNEILKYFLLYSYDRTELREHFEKIGYFDPLTRKEITEKDLVPNLALRGYY